CSSKYARWQNEHLFLNDRKVKSSAGSAVSERECWEILRPQCSLNERGLKINPQGAALPLLNETCASTSSFASVSPLSSFAPSSSSAFFSNMNCFSLLNSISSSNCTLQLCHRIMS